MLILSSCKSHAKLALFLYPLYQLCSDFNFKILDLSIIFVCCQVANFLLLYWVKSNHFCWCALLIFILWDYTLQFKVEEQCYPKVPQFAILEFWMIFHIPKYNSELSSWNCASLQLKLIVIVVFLLFWSLLWVCDSLY